MGGGSKKELQRVEYTQKRKIIYSPNNITIIDALYLYLYSFSLHFSLFVGVVAYCFVQFSDGSLICNSALTFSGNVC